jgi:thiosulfate/3-mercaptopyruvate sulfurtransferase
VRADTGRHPLPDVDRFARTLAGWGISNASQVVVYDLSGGAIAARLWWMLRWLGHQKVAVLNGGFAAWKGIDGEIETGLVEPARAEFSVRPNPSIVLKTDELAADRGSIRLIDARDRQRFLGRSEPIDPVAGHVPGARNLPFSECLDSEGLMKTPSELLGLWRDVLDKPSESRWAVMCGSGVTACHLALSAAEAGLRPPRLYVGSWSEWIRDPARPIATEFT